MSRSAVADFHAVDFRSADDFARFQAESHAIRGVRWLHEQSMATTEAQLEIAGTCGLCLTPATFRSRTMGGERTAAGFVPNWREEQRCDCDHRLINRERALLQYLLATDALLPWMRVIGFGDLGGMAGLIRRMSSGLVTYPDMPEAEVGSAGQAAPHHLAILVERMDGRNADARALGAIADALVDGGRFVFTTPFDVSDRSSDPPEACPPSRPVGWSILDRCRAAGFAAAKVCTFWSEEFGYLGPLNFIFDMRK